LLSTPRLAAAIEMNLRFPRNAARDAAELAYQRVVEQARRPEFFTLFGVPDTLDGRFELVCLHAFFYLHRLKGQAEAAAVGQRFFDTMFADFDRSLREIGTGDLSVGRQVKRMAEAFYGRIRAYEQGLDGDDAALAAALTRNLYGTAPANPDQIERMAHYVRREATRFADQPAAALIAGDAVFGAP
jgi:cytochrome b pre-mRNA-processing protein 3